MNAEILKRLAVGLCFILGGCASNQNATKTLVLSPVEEKILNLEEQIRNQENQIATLKEAIQKVSGKKGKYVSQVEKKKRPAATSKVILTKKLHPFSPEPERKIPARDLFMEAETLADSSQSAMHFYYKGLQLMNEKKFDDALQSLRTFVTQNPHHVYADRAQYLIADTHFQNKDYNLVVVATNLLEVRYPYSLKLPEALYKRSLSFIETSQSDQARVTLRNLLLKFPNDPIVGPAQKKLLELSATARK